MCKKNKDTSEFGFRSISDAKKRNGLGKYQSACKVCHKQCAKKHYHENRQEYMDRVTEFKALKRVKMYNYLSDKKCIDCEESDPLVLDFDHRDKSKKERGIAEMLRKNSWENILKEIEKCDIRCANCHRRRTAKQLGYAKYLLQQNELKNEVVTQ